MSAKEASEGYAKTAEYISHLQGALVDKINRGSEDQEAAVDSLGIRRQEKRKRVQEVQITLPPGNVSSSTCHRIDAIFLDLKNISSNWSHGLWGFPCVYGSQRGCSIPSTNLIGTVVNGAMFNHVDNINMLLKHVSETLFGTMSELVNRDMIVKLRIKEGGFDINDNNKSTLDNQE